MNATLNNLTNEELIRHFQHHPYELVSYLVNRLGAYAIKSGNMCEDYINTINELKSELAQCGHELLQSEEAHQLSLDELQMAENRADELQAELDRLFSENN